MKIHDLLSGKTTTTGTTPKATVLNLLILDASGSMSLIYNQALGGVNETLQTIRHAQAETPDLNQRVTLTSFSSMAYNIIYNNVAADQAHDITRNQYHTNGGTPLYDAIGKGIHEIEAIKQPTDSVLVTIITDGEENCSREFNGAGIKRLIEEKRGQGWVFTYIGANQDVEKVADDLAILHRLSFDASEEGTQAMWQHENQSRSQFYSRLKDKLVNNCSLDSAIADDSDFEF